MCGYIPVIGTPILNGSEWLKKQIDSVDYPVENYLITNNGGPKIYKEIQEIISEPHEYIQNFHVNNVVSNMGIAPSWNMVIKTFMHSPYWLIVNHDISFGEGFLKEINEAAQIENVKLIFGKEGENSAGYGGFELFLIKASLIQSHGLFDENFYPAYCEDIDYIMRLINKPVDMITYIDSEYYHGEGDEYEKSGSQTRRVSDKLNERFLYGWNKNYGYLDKKWGGKDGVRTGYNWRYCKPYPTPFNIPGLSIKTTTWDLDFVKDKHLTKP